MSHIQVNHRHTFKPARSAQQTFYIYIITLRHLEDANHLLLADANNHAKASHMTSSSNQNTSHHKFFNFLKCILGLQEGYWGGGVEVRRED